MKPENPYHVLVRTPADIMTAAMKIIAEPETSADEVMQLARLAFFHRVQVDIWMKLSKQYDEIAAIVICTFGSACAPEVAVFFKDGTKKRAISKEDIVTAFELELLAEGCIHEYQIEQAITGK